MMAKIDIDKIKQIIDNTPYISDVRKNFYKTILSERYEKILVPAYEKVVGRSINNNIEDDHDDYDH